MNNLEDINKSYIILSSNDNATSILYSKGYTIIPIKSYYNNQFEECIIAFGPVTNDDIRNDAILLLENCKIESAIIKYYNESNAKKIQIDGSEDNLSMLLYNTDPNNISYIHDGYSFSFIECKKYWKPSKKDDFKKGMLIEYFNNEKWIQKEVKNVELEYENLYKLLIKYNKIRANY